MEIVEINWETAAGPAGIWPCGDLLGDGHLEITSDASAVEPASLCSDKYL